jgi:hypothetical protein
MAVKFMVVDLSPAFDGTRGWISVNELEVIDPGVPGRFQAASEDLTMSDGTVFVYAFPAGEPHLRKAPDVLK